MSYEHERRERGRQMFEALRLRVVLQREPTDAELDQFGDQALYADVQAGQEMQWIRSAVHYAVRVAAGDATPADVSLFWIRVGGVFLDVRAKHQASLDFLRRTYGDDIVRAPAVAPFQALLDAISAVAAVLTEDELYYLEYRRHVECHPRQTAYRARLHKDGSLKEVQSKALGEARTQAESEDTLRRVLTRFGHDETRAAVEIATRLVVFLRAVEAAARPLNEA